MDVCASDFGGPHDPSTGSHGYHGDLLTGRMAYAELGMGTLLGGLPYKQRARITYQGKSVVAEKLDIGAGGAGCGGHARALDLWWQTAQALGFSGLGVCTFEVVDPSTPLSTVSGGATTGTPNTATPAGLGTSLSGTLKLFKTLLDVNFWKRAGIFMAGLAVIGAGIYFMLSKDPGSFKPVRKIANMV